MIRESAFPVGPGTFRKTTLNAGLMAQTESVFAAVTGTSDCAATSTKARPWTAPARPSTPGSRSARCPTPRRAGGAVRGEGRSSGSSTSPTAGAVRLLVEQATVRRPLRQTEPPRTRYRPAGRHTCPRRALARPPGRQVEVTSTRIVSLARRSVAAIEYTVEAIDEFTRVTVQYRTGRQQDQPGDVEKIRIHRRCWAGLAAGRPPMRSAERRTHSPRPPQRVDDGRRHGPRRRGAGCIRGPRRPTTWPGRRP